MSADPWDKRAEDFDRHPTRTVIGGIGRGWAVLLVLLVLTGATSAALWAAGVFTSDVKGRGDAVKIKNSGTNRVQAQALFETRYQSIKALDLRVTDAAQALATFRKDHPGVGNGTPYDPLAEQENQFQNDYTGAQQECRIAVADYDAAARTYTLKAFRDADLPQQIDQSDSATDCRANP